MRIYETHNAGGKATVRVTFTSGGSKEEVVYLLVRAEGSWKIADIKYRNGESLLKYFKEAAA